MRRTLGTLALVGALLTGLAAPAGAQASTGDDPEGIVVVDLVPSPSGRGYTMVGADGRVLTYGDATFHGSPAVALAAPIVAGAATPTGQGYWLVAADGGVFAHGDATFHGSAGGLPLNAPVVAIVPSPTGRGYRLVAADGGVFAYGDATFHGSAAELALNAPVVGATATADGYRLVAADGGIFAYGDTSFHGSAAELALNAPVIGMRPTVSGAGYHLFAADGGIFAFGDAGFLGSGAELGVRFSAFAATPDGRGYWLVTPDGAVQTFGSAPRLGSPVTGPPRRPTRPGLAGFVTLDQPTAAVVGPDGALHVAERAGRVVAVSADGGRRVVVDLSDLTTTRSERGLLGLAYDRSGAWLYVSHTDPAGDLRVAAYPTATDAPTPGTVVTGPRRVLLGIDQPFANHNGGDLHVGPDGDLWIASGDGGSGGDPMDNAQDLGTLLGKLLRITPTPDAAEPYRIPADNPFVGVPGARPEIWAYGLRNPWRFSFDPASGDLWIGDVGQSRREEIDFEPAGDPGGRNYGWNRLEGTVPFEATAPAGAVAPVHEYAHTGGRCSVTGGVVYRGDDLPELAGAYLFGDFCTGEVWALRRGDGGVTVDRLDVTVPRIVAFTTDADGEVLTVSLSGAISRLVDVAR